MYVCMYVCVCICVCMYVSLFTFAAYLFASSTKLNLNLYSMAVVVESGEFMPSRDSCVVCMYVCVYICMYVSLFTFAAHLSFSNQLNVCSMAAMVQCHLDIPVCVCMYVCVYICMYGSHGIVHVISILLCITRSRSRNFILSTTNQPKKIEELPGPPIEGVCMHVCMCVYMYVRQPWYSSCHPRDSCVCIHACVYVCVDVIYVSRKLFTIIIC
jgi:hypothetical protein